MRLQLQKISRAFAGRTAVADLDLEVDGGEVVCLLGPSGCGKSTTLRIAAGVERQDHGEVRLDGDVVSAGLKHLPPERRPIGLMFQDFALFPHLRALDNVAFGLDRRLSKSERRAKARAALERVGLRDLAGAWPHELSGGEQQRVALARALAPAPRLMLMDEPFSSLDHRLRDAVRDEALGLLKESGAAVLLVTHDPDEALRMADRIALMRDGRIVQIGAPYHIYNYPVDRRAAAFFSDINVVHARVAGGQAETAFGRFLAPGLADHADVEIIIRPQHLKVDLGAAPTADAAQFGIAAPARVVRARFMGAQSLIEARLEHDGQPLQATVPGAFLPEVGGSIWLSLRRDRCFVFPCATQTALDTPYLASSGLRPELRPAQVAPADAPQRAARERGSQGVDGEGQKPQSSEGRGNLAAE